MIRLDKVTRSFEGAKALDDLSLEVVSGRLLGVMGPGGSGKSTFCKIAAGLVKPESGLVFWDGIDLVSADRKTIAGIQSRCGVQFQNDALFEHMTVVANVAYPLGRLTDLPLEATKHKAARYLEMVGLKGFEDRLPSGLSGGQRRRVALARACVTEPDLLICDDPTAGLDPVTSRQILDMIVDIQKQANNTVVVVSADVLGLMSVADEIALLWEGKVIAKAPPSKFKQINEPRVQRFIKDAELPEQITGAV